MREREQKSRMTLNFRLVCLGGEQCHPPRWATLEMEELVGAEDGKPSFSHIKSEVVTTVSVGMSSAQL